jgi:YD repeat-containing protein
MQYNYDANGNLNRITGLQNFTATFAYDADGNLISQTNPLGQTVQLTYETNFGKLTAIFK